jgi:hypothetical protein
MLIEIIKTAQIQSRKEKNEIEAKTLTTLIGEAEMIVDVLPALKDGDSYS